MTMTAAPTVRPHLEAYLGVDVVKQLVALPAGAAGRLHHPDHGTLFWFRAHAPTSAGADAGDDLCAVYATNSMIAHRMIDDFVLDGWDTTCPVYMVTDTQLVKVFEVGLPDHDDVDLDVDEILDRQISDAQTAVADTPIGTVLVAGDVRSNSSSDFVVIELREDGWWTHSCGPDWTLDSLEGDLSEELEILAHQELRDTIRRGDVDSQLGEILPTLDAPDHRTTVTVLPYLLHN